MITKNYVSAFKSANFGRHTRARSHSVDSAANALTKLSYTRPIPVPNAQHVEQPQPLPEEEVKSQQPALAEEPKPAAWQESPTRMPLFMTPDLKGISSIISPIMSPEMSPIVYSTSATRIVLDMPLLKLPNQAKEQQQQQRREQLKKIPAKPAMLRINHQQQQQQQQQQEQQQQQQQHNDRRLPKNNSKHTTMPQPRQQPQNRHPLTAQPDPALQPQKILTRHEPRHVQQPQQPSHPLVISSHDHHPNQMYAPAEPAVQVRGRKPPTPLTTPLTTPLSTPLATSIARAMDAFGTSPSLLDLDAVTDEHAQTEDPFSGGGDSHSTSNEALDCPIPLLDGGHLLNLGFGDRTIISTDILWSPEISSLPSMAAQLQLPPSALPESAHRGLPHPPRGALTAYDCLTFKQLRRQEGDSVKGFLESNSSPKTSKQHRGGAAQAKDKKRPYGRRKSVVCAQSLILMASPEIKSATHDTVPIPPLSSLDAAGTGTTTATTSTSSRGLRQRKSKTGRPIHTLCARGQSQLPSRQVRKHHNRRRRRGGDSQNGEDQLPMVGSVLWDKMVKAWCDGTGVHAAVRMGHSSQKSLSKCMEFRSDRPPALDIHVVQSVCLPNEVTAIHLKIMASKRATAEGERGPLIILRRHNGKHWEKNLPRNTREQTVVLERNKAWRTMVKLRCARNFHGQQRYDVYCSAIVLKTTPTSHHTVRTAYILKLLSMSPPSAVEKSGLSLRTIKQRPAPCKPPPGSEEATLTGPVKVTHTDEFVIKQKGDGSRRVLEHSRSKAKCPRSARVGGPRNGKTKRRPNSSSVR